MTAETHPGHRPRAVARITETALATAAGAALAVGFASLSGQARVTIAGGIAGGLNGLLSGAREVYDWGRPRGWSAFLLDSTWGLFGTALGLAVHGVNLVSSRAVYRREFSRRRNRHVYEHGFRLKRGYLVTLGNVIGNAAGTGDRIEDRPERIRVIDKHEDLHVWQSRIFGVAMQAIYALWAVGGTLVGVAYWVLHRDRGLGAVVMTTAYYDNPFEYCAYRNDGRWPPPGAHPGLHWPGKAG